ncbi:tetratricopeptide repeat protein [uncultured Photobacterium sp.]
MLNIADSYWKLGEFDLAKSYYRKYIKRMQATNKEGRIPKFVFKRIN